jgi:hypothetical protein
VGANSTQALAIVIFLVAFTILAGAFAGGGILLALLGLACLGVSIFVFLKCKPLEHQE